MTYRIRNIGIAIALSLIAAIFTVFYVTNYKRNVQHGEKLVPVFVAAQDIPAGTAGSKLKGSSLLETEEVARRNVAPGAISSVEQIEDKIAAERVYAGEQITTRRFRPLEERGVRARIAGNMRAIQIAGDQHQLLAGTLAEGDHVDVVASLKFKLRDVAPGATQAGDIERTASRVVLRNLLVLNAPTEPDLSGRLSSSGDESFNVMVAVTDAQAQKLFFVVKNADWSLQLRPVREPADSPGSVETIESVMGDGLKFHQLRQLVYGRRTR
ncbi:MAG: Flp pilus assembly protein CpaB [Thermoleophilia bacterium]|nr:Flp pilus assembly protein CpaB [Thermoleophilia bacterium]